MSNIFEFNEFHNVLFSSIICLLNFAVFLKAHRLYCKNNDSRLAIIAAGFLIGGFFELFHTEYSFINNYIEYSETRSVIMFIYVTLSNISMATSVFISVIQPPGLPTNRVNFNKLYFFAVLLILFFAFIVQIISNLNPEIYYKFAQRIIINNPSVEILDNALYILSVLLYIDMRKLNSQRIFSSFLTGILILGIGQLYILTPLYMDSLYRFYLHISKIAGMFLIFLGLPKSFNKISISSFRYKLITYPSLLVMVFYVVFVSIGIISFNLIIPAMSQYIFLIFFLIFVVIQYLLSNKLTSKITDIINYAKELSPNKISELTQTKANDEIEVLVQKINESIKLNWQNGHELLIKQQQIWELHSREALLRKISGIIRNPVDIDKIKHSIVTEVGKTFNADRCFIRLYGPNENNILSIEAEYLASPDVKSSKDFKFNKEFNEYVKGCYNMRQPLIVRNYQNTLADPETNPAYKEFLKYLDAKSSYGFPIFINDKLIGAFVIQYTKEITQIDDNSFELFNMISDQAGIAIYQARLFSDITRREEDEKLLKEVISISKSNLDIKEILTMICEKIADAFGLERVSIIDVRGVIYEETLLSEYRTKDVKGPKEVYKHNNSELRTFWIEKILNKMETTIINDVSSCSMPECVKEIYETINVKSIIGIPLKFGDKKWGVIFVYKYHTPKYWTDNEINTLQVIKEHISIAIRETNIYSQEKFLTNISHELKTPIAIINSYTEALINRDKNKSEMGEKFLKIIKNNIDRLINIIDDILYLSAIEGNIESRKEEFSSTEILNVIKSAVELCEKKANLKNILININYNKPVYAKINSLLMQQALINLINNAINYSDVNTNINISSEENGNEILIKVKDQGCGIDPEHFENIFKRFYRIDKSRSRETGGSGLGLSIVKKIVEFHEGYVSLDSIPGEGSTFTIHLSKQ